MEKQIGATLADLVAERVTKEVTEKVTEQTTLQTRRDALRELLEERFGVLPEALLHRIDHCADVSRLKAAARQVLHLEKLDGLEL